MNSAFSFSPLPKLPELPGPGEKLLKKTTGRCPQCRRAAPASVFIRNSRVYLRRVCSEHGASETCISSDSRFYWLATGNRAEPGSCCAGGTGACAGAKPGALGRNAAAVRGTPFEQLSTCVALIEIVQSCNLSCPACYADSPKSSAVDAVPLEFIKSRIDGVIARKGGIEILQFSGGEPTLHPDFFELLEWAQKHARIDYILVNTNGVRIGSDPGFARELQAAASRGKLQLYLQFDGVQSEEQRALRGADLRRVREKAIAVCGAAQLPVTLAMTVTAANLPFVWDAIAFGLQHPHIHGITLQPAFNSGRFEAAGGSSRDQPVNAADVILSAVNHSRGVLGCDDFTPLPCGDPNCAVIGYLLRTPFGVQSISGYVDFSAMQGFLKDKVHYTVEDLAKCGCDHEPLGDLLKKLELKSSVAFRIMIKPFMDARTWDQDRIDRCCTHVIRPDGMLDSFCRYYARTSHFPEFGPARA